VELDRPAGTAPDLGVSSYATTRTAVNTAPPSPSAHTVVVVAAVIAVVATVVLRTKESSESPPPIGELYPGIALLRISDLLPSSGPRGRSQPLIFLDYR